MREGSILTKVCCSMLVVVRPLQIAVWQVHGLHAYLFPTQHEESPHRILVQICLAAGTVPVVCGLSHSTLLCQTIGEQLLGTHT